MDWWMIALYVLVGFVAQTIDGALGMAYGVSSNTFLLSLGVSPALASASVHVAEVCTTAVSGASHFRLGNVDKELFKRLLIPGVIGGALGAYILTAVPGDTIKPFIAVYLLAMGVLILYKTVRRPEPTTVRTHLIPLGLIAGFFDAIGGGGWGPIATSTLVARGSSPRHTIGSVNMAEFFVTLVESITFILTIGAGLAEQWPVIVGLLVGGVIAAPLAAVVCKKLPARALMGAVGVLIILLSIRTMVLGKETFYQAYQALVSLF